MYAKYSELCWCSQEDLAAADRVPDVAKFVPHSPRGAAPQQARAGGASTAAQRVGRGQHVAAHHRRHVPHLRGRPPAHRGHGLLPAVTPLRLGAHGGLPQHRGQPSTLRPSLGKLPGVFLSPLVHFQEAETRLQNPGSRQLQGAENAELR